jgi:hypothetical protein
MSGFVKEDACRPSCMHEAIIKCAVQQILSHTTSRGRSQWWRQ